jgi:hypothetical protein
MANETEIAEISAAKDTVYAVLEQFFDCEENDLIGVADRAVEALLKGGVLIPPWMPQPFNDGHPAQGAYPTSSQMEAWEARKPKWRIKR